MESMLANAVKPQASPLGNFEGDVEAPGRMASEQPPQMKYTSRSLWFLGIENTKRKLLIKIVESFAFRSGCCLAFTPLPALEHK
jgi:hypothetical protein